MFILSETATRREYKTKWQALNRAKAAGLDINLVDAFYKEMRARKYSREYAITAILYAAKQGAFGLINTWER